MLRSFKKSLVHWYRGTEIWHGVFIWLMPRLVSGFYMNLISRYCSFDIELFLKWRVINNCNLTIPKPIAACLLSWSGSGSCWSLKILLSSLFVRILLLSSLTMSWTSCDWSWILLFILNRHGVFIELTFYIKPLSFFTTPLHFWWWCQQTLSLFPHCTWLS